MEGMTVYATELHNGQNIIFDVHVTLEGAKKSFIEKGYKESDSDDPNVIEFVHYEIKDWCGWVYDLELKQ